MNNARMGAILGGINIAFSLLCFLITPMFTAAIILAALFGAVSCAIALKLQARRTALVVMAFALAPLVEFLVIEHVVERVHNGYVAFLPLVVAAAVAAWELKDYLRARRAAG
jgi:ABC-type microcin C transport system permease subunit YejE